MKPKSYDAVMAEKIRNIKKQITELGHEHLKTKMPDSIDNILRHMKPWAEAEKALENLEHDFELPF